MKLKYAATTLIVAVKCVPCVRNRNTKNIFYPISIFMYTNIVRTLTHILYIVHQIHAEGSNIL